jgi:hypothetical protein
VRVLPVSQSLSGNGEECCCWAEETRSLNAPVKRAVKNFGDAHRVPFVVACCRFLVLFAAFFLCFFLGCHGSILPFHSSWNLQRCFVATK